MADSPKYDAFLSYSRRDRAWVSDLYKNLTGCGARVFLDSQEINRTEEITKKINAALKESKFLLLALTPDAIASPWVRTELHDRTVPVLVAKLATAPLPRDVSVEPADEFDFEPEREVLADYQQQYRDEFERLCGRLGLVSVRPRVPRVHPPPFQLKGSTYGRALDVLERALAWPATRKGLCVMLGLGEDTLDTEEEPRMAANFLVHRIGMEKGLPRVRACRAVMKVVKKGCELEPESSQQLEEVLVELDGAVGENVDDDFVHKVRDAIGEDRYSVHGILGGSFTIVLQAKDHTLERDVIVKVLRPAVSAPGEPNEDGGTTASQPPEVQDAFRDYAQAAAAVDHSKFARVHGARFTDDVSLCICDFSPGVTVASLIRLGEPLHVDLILTLLNMIGRALHYLDENDLVHTFINPENMFVDPSGRVKISPFGIARPGKPVTPIPHLYRVANCPSRKAELYLAPEAQGAAPYSPDRRVHQFGLGLLAAELLRGESLDLELGREAAKTEIAHRLDLEASTVWASDDGPKKTQRLLQKLLSSGPERRYDTTLQAVRALNRALKADTGAKLLKNVGDFEELGAKIEEITVRARRKMLAANRARESLLRVLTDDFLRRFHEELQSHEAVARIFEAQWEGRDRAQVERDYFKKLRQALTTIIEYGRHSGYESLRLERVIASHTNYRVAGSMYRVFTDTLMKTLEGWEPPFGDRENADDVRKAWELLNGRVLRYVQGGLQEPTSAPPLGFASRYAGVERSQNAPRRSERT